MVTRALVIVLGLLATGCQSVLKPDYGYPADWPALTVLGSGFTELAGTYANDGTATTASGGTVTIQLAGLLPDGERLPLPGGPGSAADSGETVALELLAPAGWPRFPRLRAVVTTRHGTQVSEVEAGSDRSSLLYLLQMDGPRAFALGLDAGQMTVRLTRGVDGSLIARISEDQSVAMMVEPSDLTSAVWARFERISP
jgi:hypothetical protein